MFTASLESMPDEAMQKRSLAALRLMHAATGMSTEANEFLDQLRKHVFYGKTLDETNLKEELGDLFFFASRACELLGVDIIDMLEANVRKLRERYPEGKFTQHHFANRNVLAEMDAIEDKDKIR